MWTKLRVPPEIFLYAELKHPYSAHASLRREEAAIEIAASQAFPTSAEFSRRNFRADIE